MIAEEMPISTFTAQQHRFGAFLQLEADDDASGTDDEC
jgi:hypothetical protein